jgi:hypothetical protein
VDFSKLAGRARKIVDAARENVGSGNADAAGLADQARTALQAARQGLQEVAAKAEQSPLAERAREVMGASGERLAALTAEGQGTAAERRGARILRDTIARVRDAATRESFERHRERATELLTSTRDDARAMSDRAAASVAEFYAERTGRPVTPEQVKRVAISVGAAVVVAATLSAMMETGSSGAEFSGDQDGGRADGFGSSFEGEVSRFFADKGGLNIETQVVDGDGVILS